MSGNLAQVGERSGNLCSREIRLQQLNLPVLYSYCNSFFMRDVHGEFGLINVHLFDIMPAVSSVKVGIFFLSGERWPWVTSFCIYREAGLTLIGSKNNGDDLPHVGPHGLYNGIIQDEYESEKTPQKYMHKTHVKSQLKPVKKDYFTRIIQERKYSSSSCVRLKTHGVKNRRQSSESKIGTDFWSVCYAKWTPIFDSN